MKNKKSLLALVTAVAISIPLLTVLTTSSAQNAQSSGVIETRSHVFTPVADGIYFITATGAVNLTSQSMLIEGLHDLLVVDSHVSPDAGLALLDSIKAVSNKPVRYLINTHYHFDHAHGNQVFPRDVEIIGSQYTRDKLSGELGNVLEESTFISFTQGMPAQIERLRAQLEQSAEAHERASVLGQIAMLEAHLNSVAEIELTPPNITVSDTMTIYQDVVGGGREIQLIHTGRGHTGGDMVVFLPHEKILYAGDLVGQNLIYMGDAYANEWADVLERIKALDFDLLLSGHGPLVESRERIDAFQAYLRDLWSKTSELKRSGLSAEDAAQQIDMTNHSANYPQIRAAGADVRAIRRIYNLME